MLDAYRGGRMHHAWLIGGPKGIGKATLGLSLRPLRRWPIPIPPPAPGARRATCGRAWTIRRFARSPRARIRIF